MESIQRDFPIWDKLGREQQKALTAHATTRAAPKGTVLHNGSADCVGLFLIRSGRLRAYMVSDEGKEITLYRLFERDICLFSASCIFNSLQFDVIIEAEEDTSFWLVPAPVYREMMEQCAPVANYTNELMSTRFTDVMWLMEQILFKSFDARLAAFLLEESGIRGAAELRITHEQIARHLGSAREVVTRMLRYFQNEGLVELSRGVIRLLDRGGLEHLAG